MPRNILRFLCTVNVFCRTIHVAEPGEAVVDGVLGVLEGDAPPSESDPVPEDELDEFVPEINEEIGGPGNVYCVGVLNTVGS